MALLKSAAGSSTYSVLGFDPDSSSCHALFDCTVYAAYILQSFCKEIFSQHIFPYASSLLHVLLKESNRWTFLFAILF
jgi:hypothetical protein